MKSRLLRELKIYGVILAIGITYFIFVKKTGLRIPCPFYLFSGLLCPGCGITRMIISASALDLANAYAYNKLMFVSWPLVAIPLIFSEISYVKNGSRKISRASILLWIEAVLMVIFGIVRNII